MSITRRTFLQASLLTLSACSLPKMSLKQGKGEYDYELTAEPAPLGLVPGKPSPGLAFNGQYPAPVIRAKQGVPLRITFTNKLNEPTTIHWHGIRIRNDMDGVPHLTQKPIQPGETFVYEFICPDAGTFWYHPHMNSVEQLGKGLTGALIVEEKHPPAFDHEAILQLRDWRLDRNGQWLPLSIPRNAFRMGTLGTVKTVNGKIKPVIEIPAGGLIRARFLNIDNTRVYHLALGDQPAQVLAIDGNALARPHPLDVHDMGAGMRLDLGFVAPAEVGREVVIYDQKGRWRGEICRFKTVATDVPESVAPGPLTGRNRIPALPVNPIPKPDLAGAETLNLTFEWQGALSPTGKNGEGKHDFWTINRRSWEHMMEGHIPEPLATLKLGKSYIVEMYNATPHHHPIHMHGVTFTVIESNKKKITPFHTDTVLMEKYEKVRIAFVADNPGRWMFHCHVIEHMKTGLMGYLTIA